MKAWDDIWKTRAGRIRWLEPDPFVVAHVPKFRREGIEKVLDLGFGLGRHAILFAREDFDVYGIDTSPTGLGYAIKWAEEENVTLQLRRGEMIHLPFDSAFFDMVIAWNVLYHGTTDYIRKAIAEIERCLKPAGYLICTFISTRHNKYGVGEEIEEGTFVIAEEKEKNHPHHYFDLQEIQGYLSRFSLLKCEDCEQSGAGTFHWLVLARHGTKHTE